MRRAVHESGSSEKVSFVLLSRWYGLGALSSGLLFLVWGYVDRPGVEGLYGVLVEALSFAVPALIATGFMGFHAWFQRRGSRLGSAGAILGLVGALWGAAQGLLHILSEELSSTVVNWEWAHMPFGWLELLSTGLIFSGIVPVSAGTSRSPGIVSLAIGTLGWGYLITDSNAVFEMRFVHLVCGILFALGWMALGAMLLLKAWRRED